MDSICQEIGIHIQHTCETPVPERYQLICDKAWLQTLEKKHKISHFPYCPKLDRRAHPAGPLEHPWTRILVQIYKKHPHTKVFHSQQPDEYIEDARERMTGNRNIPMTYSQAVLHVTNANYKNLWESSYKKYPGAHIKFCKQNNARADISTLGLNSPNCHDYEEMPPYDVVLKETIQRAFHCPVIHCNRDRLCEENIGSPQSKGNTLHFNGGECSPNVMPAIIAIETSAFISVFFYPPSVVTTLYDCVTYSPAILGKAYNKPLFILYQLFQTAKDLHSAGLFLGDLRLHDIMLNENLWLQIIPNLECNILLPQHQQPQQQQTNVQSIVNTPSDIVMGENNASACTDIEHIHNNNDTTCADCSDGAVSDVTKFDLKFAYDLEQFTLREFCEMWCSGQLSNFDYLTILNNCAGRSLSNPAYHHIMPWVTDFATRAGANWRDLTKSKYRLNKGDVHLDLMFSQANASGINACGTGGLAGCGGIIHESSAREDFAHHVSDFLSDITYFVYMARRTPQHILCEHVRPIWVPAEYPVSIQRLQEWTPDECIPEFYSDPSIFKSIHEDLPDLELPTWASCPEDFICKHREALESQYVSERLHHWIDLNFGYKLTGKAAVKSKNVCLSVVDQHKNLCQRGIVQLFTLPHPPKRFPLPWFNKTAPRLNQLYQNSTTIKSPSRINNQNTLSSSFEARRLARSTENLSTSAGAEISGGSPNNSPRMPLRPANSVQQDTISIGSNSSANFYPVINFIELPKDYNPSALLQSLETQENFFARTFAKQKSMNAGVCQEKIINNDLMFDESSEENSFTNRLYDHIQNNDGISVNGKRVSNKNFIAPSARAIKKHTLHHILKGKRARELQVLACLIVELFAMQRLRALLMNGIACRFEERLSACRTVSGQFKQDIPKALRYVVRMMLNENNQDVVSDKGLPPISAAQILEPIFANVLIPFPNNYYAIYALTRTIHAFEFNARLLELHTHFNCNGKECARYSEMDRTRVLFQRKIAECKVMACCAHIGRLLDPIAYEQFPAVEILLPHIIDLLYDEQTSILAAWNLFDPVAQALGVAQTQKHLLQPLMKLYDVESFERGMHSLRARSFADSISSPNGIGGGGQVRFSVSSSFKSRKSVKLYHHSFLLRLIVRFGLRCFLHNFITPLIEAVGGYKEPEESTGFHYHSSSGHDTIPTRRTSKNLSYAANTENSSSSLTMRSAEDTTLMNTPRSKEEVEEVFSFEEDAISNPERLSNSGTGENKSIDSFDMRPTTAEEAKEETTSEKLAISELIYGSKISCASLDELSSDGALNNSGGNGEDEISAKNQTLKVGADYSGGGGPVDGGNAMHDIDAPPVLRRGPKSPTIDIPSISSFSRSYQLNAIDCDIGSRKSVDSLEILTQATAENVTVRQQHSKPGDSTLSKSQQQDEDENSLNSLQASVISKMSEAKQAQNNRISEMSAESLIWLSHRLGPVLTSRFITRNLLKMLTLCYVGQENLMPDDLAKEEEVDLNYFSIADARVVGDRSASRVLQSLMSIAALFGEPVILLQYFPHVSELVALGSKRLTTSLEGTIISALQLVKYMVPCLTDITLMECLKDVILDSILLPALRLLSSSGISMPNAYLGRSVLTRKFVDAVYALCVRIGPDMSKEHICQPVLRPFFLIFDKAYHEVSGQFEKTKNATTDDINELSISPPAISNTREMEELKDVFSAAMAHTAYLVFLRFLGEHIMRRTLINIEFILTLCHEIEHPDYNTLPHTTLGDSLNRKSSDAVDCPTENKYTENTSIHDDVGAANSFGTQIVGNRIEVLTPSNMPKQESEHKRQTTNNQQALNSADILDMVAYKFDHVPTTRHLKGNWLAYWRHEITRSEKDSTLNLKQIKLQSFVGHSNSVRAIVALDNENSFISASKDKTVKLWSLRSEGDGTKVTSCQFTYTAHKKAIHSLAFLEAMRFVVSCDSGVHIWDPFIGRPLGILDSAHRHNPITVVKSLPSPSPLIAAGTAEASVKLIDSRCMQYVNEWRVTPALQGSSTVRCLTVAPSGNWLAVGLSSGSIIMLDIRTGIVLNAWRPMECDLLQMTAPNDQQLVTSSLDHSLAVWHAADGILHYQLKPPAEPAHYLQTINSSELVFATTGNRVGVYADLFSSHAAYSVTKLRSETFRGVLTSLAVLPLNRAFLAGNESGNIVLFC